MRKRTTVRVISFLAAGLVTASATAVRSAERARSLELYARANTQHAFDELVTSVSELSNTLEKSVYVTDPALESALCTQLFGRAVTAQMAMGALPWSSQELERMSGFLSRVGDYACVLSRTVGETGGYTEEELENLTALAETAGVMSLNLQDIQDRMLSGRLTMNEVYSAAEDIEAGEGEAPLAGTAFQSVEAEFPELPTLIYDGPFSESMMSQKPLFLEGKSQVSQAEAQTAAAEFLGLPAEELEYLGPMGGAIPCRTFAAVTEAGEYTVQVTDRGGIVLSALCSRLPGSERLTTDKALAAAERFLAQQGIEGMEESYHMAEDGIMTVNYEYAQDGVLCYPDLIKVGIALDTGAVMSYDARGYISCHRDRELPEMAVSAETARETIAQALRVREQGLAVIPSPGGEERLCHEFLCQAKDERRYLVYVNAVTGAQEKILILLEDGAGTLTI